MNIGNANMDSFPCLSRNQPLPQPRRCVLWASVDVRDGDGGFAHDNVGRMSIGYDEAVEVAGVFRVQTLGLLGKVSQLLDGGHWAGRLA